MPANRVKLADVACHELLDRILSASQEVARIHQIDRRHLLDTVLLALLISRIESAEKWDQSLIEHTPPLQ